MNGRDDHMAGAGVRVPDAIPDVPLPPGNDPDTVSRWARAVMDSFGLQDWAFAFDDARRRLGCCNYQTMTVSLSRHLVARNGPADLRETLLHEAAHALVGGGHGHDGVWKAMALRVGARPTRCGHADMPEGEWRADCPSCRRRFSRHRRPMRPTGWFCKCCGPRRGVLIWERQEALP